MDISRIFDLTLESHGISGKWLASESGVSEVVISRFRNGRRVYTDTLGKLLAALPFEAQRYFLETLLGTSLVKGSPDLEQVVQEADGEQVAELLGAISRKIKASSKAKA